MELYFARDVLDKQPILRFDRPPGDVGVRWIVMNLGGVVVSANSDMTAKKVTSLDQGETRGQERLGRVGYRIGYWVQARHECVLYEVLRNGRVSQLGPVRHPCWPKPRGPEVFDPARHGFGVAPSVVGLLPGEVTPPTVEPLLA